MDYNDLVLRDKISKRFADLGIDGRIDLLLMHYADNKYKSSITDEQQQILDYVFSGYYPRLVEDEGQSHIEDRELRKHHNERNYRNETLDMMVEEKLVTTDLDMGYVTYTPTAFGRRINERGGWTKHLKREEADRTLVSRASKTSIRTAWVSLIFIGATALFTWQDKTIHQSELDMHVLAPY